MYMLSILKRQKASKNVSSSSPQIFEGEGGNGEEEGKEDGKEEEEEEGKEEEEEEEEEEGKGGGESNFLLRSDLLITNSRQNKSQFMRFIG